MLYFIDPTEHKSIVSIPTAISIFIKNVPTAMYKK